MPSNSSLTQQDQWPEASELPYYLEFDNSKQPTGLKHLVPDCSPELLDFLERTLQLNPLKRLKAVEMMKHPYLQGETPSARQ
jgi:serine/threonine protein kinase